MELFRSRKRDIEQVEDSSGLQKRHHTLSGSLDDLLDIAKDDEEYLGTASENTASESDEDDNDINKASKKQKAFAKISIKREKRKEKEQRKKTEKNLISMDDFLGKQTEFKMWLFEEKSKNAGEMASPKLKAHFKQFVRLWNKKKLASKYYRCSDLPESPAPLTPKKFNFLSQEVTDKGSPLMVDQENEVTEKEPPTSPFITFGKTPPKVFRSKKFQLFGSSKEVALLSVAPINSPQPCQLGKDNHSIDQYQVPKAPKACKKEDMISDKMEMPRGATPYKVSIFPWASKDLEYTSNTGDKVDICSTNTPPSLTIPEEQGEEAWPPPPSENEIHGDRTKSSSDSPHVPPPPPPRLESLQKPSSCTRSPKLAGNYADPYDTVSEIQSSSRRLVHSDYQDPVDCVPDSNGRTVPESSRLVLQSVAGSDEPDLSLYCKPVPEKRFSKEELEELYAKPLKRAKRNNIGSLTDTEEKKREKPAEQSDLFNEIMDHINNKQVDNKEVKMLRKPDPDYETIEDCMAMIESTKTEQKTCLESKEEKTKTNENLSEKSEDKTSPKFATISRSKKMRVMAASTEKIYQTYLSMGRKANPFKAKVDIPKAPETRGHLNSGTFTQSLKLKSKSQPDISFSEGMQPFDIDMSDDNVKRPFAQMSSFKPVGKDAGAFDEKLKNSDRAKSHEDCLRTIEEPRTPIIMATPSFDSLCEVTPLSCKSFSSQSLPTKSGSAESLSGHSHMSTSTTSSLSFGPYDKSGSLQSLQSEKSLSPVKEKEELPTNTNATSNYENRRNGMNGNKVQLDDFRKKPHGDVYGGKTIQKDCTIPLTPGKISALKHGIDLSVYLLKPVKSGTVEKPGPGEKDVHSEQDKENKTSSDGESGKAKRLDFHHNQKLFDTQSRLAIKEKLSGVKTKVDYGKATSKKEIERRHTVQTVPDISEKCEDVVMIPNVGITLKNRKADTLTTFGKNKIFAMANEGDNGSKEPDSKRRCGEGKRVLSVDDHYLETDLDKVLSDRGRKPMKKSKSHSGFETDSVVTEIW